MDDFGKATLVDNGYVDDYRPPFSLDSFYKCYLNSQARKQELLKVKVDSEYNREDASTLTASNNCTRSRQELKQLDGELPWNELVNLPRASYEKYLESV